MTEHEIKKYGRRLWRNLKQQHANGQAIGIGRPGGNGLRDKTAMLMINEDDTSVELYLLGDKRRSKGWRYVAANWAAAFRLLCWYWDLKPSDPGHEAAIRETAKIIAAGAGQ